MLKRSGPSIVIKTSANSTELFSHKQFRFLYVTWIAQWKNTGFQNKLRKKPTYTWLPICSQVITCFTRTFDTTGTFSTKMLTSSGFATIRFDILIFTYGVREYGSCKSKVFFIRILYKISRVFYENIFSLYVVSLTNTKSLKHSSLFSFIFYFKHIKRPNEKLFTL